MKQFIRAGNNFQGIFALVETIDIKQAVKNIFWESTTYRFN